jgi:tellurite resistance protein
MAAITLATILMYEFTHYWVYSILAYFFMIVTTIIVFLVARQTIIHMNKKEICIME